MKAVQMLVAACLVVVTCSTAAMAEAPRAEEEAAVDTSSLAKKTQNPVSDLVSMPFQFNFNTGGGLEDRTLFNLNFQPVFPISVSKEWNLIARTIVPYLDIPIGTGLDRESGIGDVQEQLYFTPAGIGKMIWGIGPMFSFPTATNDAARTGTWALGPGAVALTMAGPWVVGGLVNQYWPYADSGSSRKTNLLVMQPFVNYNFGKGWAMSFAPIISADWDAPSGQKWTVPLGIGITRTLVFGKQPMALGVQYYRNVEHPDAAAASQLRIVLSLLFPTKK